MKLSDELKVSLVTALCILTLAVVSKNILNVQFDVISQSGPVWMLVVYLATKNKAAKSKTCASPLLWSLAIIIVTMAILLVYAI